ncbi:Trimethyltridecatetraene synthase [Camellia lanceoleosa]|uniref:Trimethyltridecatetraene synthase n=1 Tax=Camellia lanceoleosa TaxID=1840588 RepID=A0ACC0FPL3_9ERIC|nr:Trimethyltridecatetraene synthase [Camellia lanceoleosa]
MVAPSWAILALAWLATLTLLSKLINLRHRRQKKLPPGPKPWPIIGNLNLVGSKPHQSFHMLSKKYGEIMQLKFGSFPIVVASSPKMAKQFLKTHGKTFASRPATAAGKYTSYNYCDMTWAPYRPHWRQARKIYLNELFSPEQLDTYEYIRVEELHALISRLYALSGKEVAIREHLAHSVKLDELREMVNEWFWLNGVFNIGDWIPWLSFLDLQGYVKRIKALYRKLDKFHSYVIDDHKARRAGDKDFVAKDIVDLVLKLADDPNLEGEERRESHENTHSLHYHIRHVDPICDLSHCFCQRLDQDPITGGTDTSSVTVEWAISKLVKQPQFLRKATEELDRVIARDRWVEEKDIPQLPYINLIAKETMRLHHVATLLAPHYSIEDCNVAGYDIPKGTTVFLNTWGIARDPKYWVEPEVFNPERFVGKEIDVKGQHFELLPFGSGERMCPAYNLGLKLVKATLANLLHGFNWKLPDNMKPEDVDIEKEYGLTTHRKVPIVVVTEPRLSAHLYN